VDEWARSILELLNERERHPAAWEARRTAGLLRAAEFSWSRYTTAVVERYKALAGIAPEAQPA
jgi:hypothetical protein